jgi:hypothetical protein
VPGAVLLQDRRELIVHGLILSPSAVPENLRAFERHPRPGALRDNPRSETISRAVRPRRCCYNVKDSIGGAPAVNPEG